LGLPHDWFDHFSMAEYRALHEVWESRHERQILYSGIVAAEVRNTLRADSADRVWTAADWIAKADEQQEPAGFPTAEQLKLKAMALCASMGGAIKHRTP
jgi:hypothetical protein